MTFESVIKCVQKESVADIHFCTTPEVEKDDACNENLRKAEFIGILEKRIPKIFESFVRYSGEFEYSLFLDLWGKNPAEFNLPNMDRRVFKFVQQNLSVGLMFLFGTDEDNLTLVVPDEFLEIVRGADRSMAGFHDYCKVCANLYGICHADTVVDKWNANHKDCFLTKSKGVSCINECSLFTRFFTCYDDCLCNWSVETEVVMDTIIEGRKIHKPYRPTDAEFMGWLDYLDDINENLEEFKTIRDHFVKYSENPVAAEFDALCLLDDLRIGLEHPTAIIEKYRLQIGFTRIDMNEITPVIGAIMELNNKARLWVTYGNSPDELSSSRKPVFGMQNMVAQSPVLRTTPKVGRNDPCPCGSGLKFKKCCGKMVN